MSAQMYRLGSSDIIKGAITAVMAAVITTLYGIVQQSGFDLFAADYGAIFSEVVKVSFSAFLAYLMKNFFSDEEGNFAGVKV